MRNAEHPTATAPPRPVPGWARICVGTAGVALGVWCVASPAVSLAVHTVLVPAVAVSVGLARRSSRRVAAAAGLLTAVGAAAAVVARPAETVGLLVGGLAVAVMAGAVIGLVRRRVVGVVGAATWMGLGALLLTWPDVAAYLVAIAAGLATTACSAAALLSVRPVPTARRRAATDPTGRRGLRWPARVGALGALAAVGWLLLVSVAVLVPRPAPEAVPSTAATPGTLTAAVALDPQQGVAGWRITYATTRADGAPTSATGLVLVPPGPPGPRPVIAWAHGSVGYPARCAPSGSADPIAAVAAGAPGPILAALTAGWAVVAADYTAPGSEDPPPYLVGEGEARAVLDSVRAAAALPAALAVDEVAIWGHSQGGHAALWAGALARDYAPGIGVAGVAALAPVVDLPAVVDGLDTAPGGSIFLAGLVSAYADTYPDVAADRAVRPGAAYFLRSLATRCLTEPAALAPLSAALLWPGPLLARPLDPAFAQRLRENIPPPPVGVPVFLAQGAADVLVRPAVQEVAAGSLCAAGAAVGYRSYPGLDHAGLVGASSPLLPDLAAWTATLWTDARVESDCAG